MLKLTTATTEELGDLDYDPSCDCYEGWRQAPGGWVVCKCRVRCLQKKKAQRIAKTYPLPLKLREKRFENYHPRNEKQKYALRQLSSGVPCYLFGPYGTGKTHLLAASVIQKRLELFPAIFVSAPWLFEQIRRESFRYQDDVDKVIDDMVSVDFLAIDDLGKEKLTATVEEKLFMIVDRRLQNGLNTSFSSNFPLDHPDNRINGAIRSRIYEMCEEIICIKGPDYRKLCQINKKEGLRP